MSTSHDTPHDTFKATGTTRGGWYGCGYGTSPAASLASLLGAMPKRERSMAMQSVRVCARVDHGETFSFPRSAEIDRNTLADALRLVGFSERQTASLMLDPPDVSVHVSYLFVVTVEHVSGESMTLVIEREDADEDEAIADAIERARQRMKCAADELCASQE